MIAEVAYDRFNCHLHREWPSYRRIILFIIQHYETSYNDSEIVRKEANWRLDDLIGTVFQDCCFSNRASDIKLFENFYDVLNALYLFAEWVPELVTQRSTSKDKPCLSWIASDYQNVPKMMEILKEKDCDCGKECARRRK